MENLKMRSAEEARANFLFEERFRANAIRTDRMLAALMIGQWIFGIVIAVLVSPYAWAGKVHVVHAHVLIAVFLGGTISGLPVLLASIRPGWPLTRYVMAMAQMLWSALLIHLTGGRIETHFHVFGSLAFLAFYRDWKVLLPATVVVATDHMLRQFLWPESVFGILAPESWRFLEHAAWVLFEDIILVWSCLTSVEEMRNIAGQQAKIEHAEKARDEQEMRIASNIQTSILPRNIQVEGLEAAAKMLPALDVGGDYYDILPVEDGCWVGIGDVAGHGLKAGLVMLQAQSAIAALVGGNPNAAPRDIIEGVNRVLYENVRKRLVSNEHVTMSLIRYFSDGRLVFAGAHEEAIIWRAATKKCELVDVAGAWLGAIKEIGAVTVETKGQLSKGDLLVLYTDGITEARDTEGKQFGLTRLCEMIEQHARSSVTDIRDSVLDSSMKWAGNRQDDDLTLVVLRHNGIVRAATT